MGGSRAKTGWPGLFWAAFKRSRNAMSLLDVKRRHVEVNGAFLQLTGYKRKELIGRPVREILVRPSPLSDREWHRLMSRPEFFGARELRCADERTVTVEFAANPETVTGRQLILVVVLRRLRGGYRDIDATEKRSLSEREMEIVGLIALGLTSPEIANELHLSRATIGTHVRNAMDKLGVHTRAHLVAKVIGEGIVPASTSPAHRR